MTKYAATRCHRAYKATQCTECAAPIQAREVYLSHRVFRPDGKHEVVRQCAACATRSGRGHLLVPKIRPKHDGPCVECGGVIKANQGRKCGSCYARASRRVRKAKRCLEPMCDRPQHAKERCISHYQKGRTRKPPPRPTPTGHWEARGNIMIVHWPTKGHEFPHECQHCGTKILEAAL